MIDVAPLVDALGGIEGVEIRVRHRLPEPSMRLMETLNVRVIVDPSAPSCAQRCCECAVLDGRRDRRRPAQLSVLPGDTWDDIFGDAA